MRVCRCFRLITKKKKKKGGEIREKVRVLHMYYYKSVYTREIGPYDISSSAYTHYAYTNVQTGVLGLGTCYVCVCDGLLSLLSARFGWMEEERAR